MRVRKLICLAVWLAAETLRMLAAGPEGSIIGNVTDPSGRVVPQAQVTIRNQATNAERKVQTYQNGEYSAPLLPPGNYEVAVTAPGFQRAVHGNVTLTVSDTVRVDVQLALGKMTESVVVTASPPLLQTDSAALGQVVDGRKITGLPLNERNFL